MNETPFSTPLVAAWAEGALASQSTTAAVRSALMASAKAAAAGACAGRRKATDLARDCAGRALITTAPASADCRSTASVIVRR